MSELTIEDLLNALQNPETGQLENNAETWSRIGKKDDFSELGLEASELDDFLAEWIGDNPYENL
jgi:hypothetical protein